MTSWRDATPRPVQHDLDAIVATSIDAARKVLEENGEFCPFGIVMTVDGDTRTVASDPSLSDQAQARATLDELYAGILGEQNDIRAAAVVSDVDVDASSAIRVRCEHRDGGPAMEILLRYAKHRTRGGIDYGLSSVSGTERRVWPLPEISQGRDTRGGRQPSAGSSPIRWFAIAKFLVATPVCLVVALALVWLGTFRATTFDGPIPLTPEELWTGRAMVICAGLVAGAPFAVVAWKLRKGSPLVFSMLVVVASLMVAASLGLAFALPFSGDHMGNFQGVSAWRG